MAEEERILKLHRILTENGLISAWPHLFRTVPVLFCRSFLKDGKVSINGKRRKQAVRLPPVMPFW